MISWHKVGQKVALVREWDYVPIDPDFQCRAPSVGTVYTVSAVEIVDVPPFGDLVGFELVEMPAEAWFAASLFLPVYPQAIEDLRRLCSDTPVPVDA